MKNNNNIHQQQQQQQKHQTISFSAHTRYNVCVCACVFLYYFALFITDRIIENMYMKRMAIGWDGLRCDVWERTPLYSESSCGWKRRIYLGTAGWGWVRYCVCLFVYKKYFKRKMWRKKEFCMLTAKRYAVFIKKEKEKNDFHIFSHTHAKRK